MKDATPDEDIVAEDRMPHVAVVGNAYRSVRYHVVIEKTIVMRCNTFAAALHQLFMIFFTVNLEYPVEKKRSLDFYTFIQKVVMEMERGKLNAKLTSFVASLARLQ